MIFRVSTGMVALLKLVQGSYTPARLLQPLASLSKPVPLQSDMIQGITLLPCPFTYPLRGRGYDPQAGALQCPSLRIIVIWPYAARTCVPGVHHPLWWCKSQCLLEMGRGVVHVLVAYIVRFQGITQ